MFLVCGILVILFVVGGFAQNGPLVPDYAVAPAPNAHSPHSPIEAKAAEAKNEPALLGAATGYAPYQQKYESRSGGSGNYGGSGSAYNGGGGGGGGGEAYDSGYGSGPGCYGRPAGSFGDVNYDCKTFQVCQSDGRLDTFYCPPYTRFNNYLGVCDWHFKVDSYCNPLYKEEYYENNGGSNNYGSGNSGYSDNNYKPPYSPPVISYEKPYSAPAQNNYGSGGGNNYNSGSSGSGYSGGGGNGGGYSGGRPPVYNLMAGGNSGSQGAAKY